MLSCSQSKPCSDSSVFCCSLLAFCQSSAGLLYPRCVFGILSVPHVADIPVLYVHMGVRVALLAGQRTLDSLGTQVTDLSPGWPPLCSGIYVGQVTSLYTLLSSGAVCMTKSYASRGLRPMPVPMPVVVSLDFAASDRQYARPRHRPRTN